MWVLCSCVFMFGLLKYVSCYHGGVRKMNVLAKQKLLPPKRWRNIMKETEIRDYLAHNLYVISNFN